MENLEETDADPGRFFITFFNQYDINRAMIFPSLEKYSG